MSAVTTPLTNHGSATPANELFTALTGAEPTLPPINLSDDKFQIPWDTESFVYKPVQALDPSIITSKEVGGSGIFDVMMSGLGAHLRKEFDEGRVTQADYVKAYVALTEVALGNAVQFALGKDQASWQAARAQADAITAKLNNETARYQAILAQAQYALTKLKLATEDTSAAQAEYQLHNILPEQKAMISEQKEAQRAQTMDNRTDAAPVAGVLRRQRDLYEQQLKSYKEDAKVKAAKVFSDLWVTQKGIDESTEPAKYFDPSYTDSEGVPLPNGSPLDGIFKQIRLSALGEDAPQADKDWTP